MTRGGMTGTWGRAGVRCKVKNLGREGEALVYFSIGRVVWVAVIWDGENEPVCVPESRLLFKHPDERTFKPRNRR